jgi:hypothetical protein
VVLACLGPSVFTNGYDAFDDGQSCGGGGAGVEGFNGQLVACLPTLPGEFEAVVACVVAALWLHEAPRSGWSRLLKRQTAVVIYLPSLLGQLAPSQVQPAITTTSPYSLSTCSLT